MREIATSHGSVYFITHVFLGFTPLDASVAQIAIAWLLHQPTVSSIVIGARTIAQLEDNIKAAFIELSDDEVSKSRKHTYYK